MQVISHYAHARKIFHDSPLPNYEKSVLDGWKIPRKNCRNLVKIMEWYEELIRSGNRAKFYSSGPWKSLSAEIKEKNHNECIDCRKKGWYSPAEEVHHVAPIRIAPERAMDATNLVPLCRECHARRHGHHRDQHPVYTTERW